MLAIHSDKQQHDSRAVSRTAAERALAVEACRQYHPNTDQSSAWRLAEHTSMHCIPTALLSSGVMTGFGTAEQAMKRLCCTSLTAQVTVQFSGGSFTPSMANMVVCRHLQGTMQGRCKNGAHTVHKTVTFILHLFLFFFFHLQKIAPNVQCSA